MTNKQLLDELKREAAYTGQLEYGSVTYFFNADKQEIGFADNNDSSGVTDMRDSPRPWAAWAMAAYRLRPNPYYTPKPDGLDRPFSRESENILWNALHHAAGTTPKDAYAARKLYGYLDEVPRSSFAVGLADEIEQLGYTIAKKA